MHWTAGEGKMDTFPVSYTHITWVISWHMQDIIFESVWNLFFDLMIEMAATYKVNVSLDLRKKKAWLRHFNVCGAMCRFAITFPVFWPLWCEVLTEAQLTSFTQRLANLQIPVIQLEMPPNQVPL